jgi:hypothetical protein
MTATLAHVQARYRLLAICDECAHTVELDVDGLITTLGGNHPVPAIKRRLRCSRCGSVSCAVQLALPDWQRQPA